MTKPVALTIAGSDSSGGAGIQADIKSMEANGVYAASVVTAVTAQNTQAVNLSYDVPERIIAEQIDAVADDLPVAVTKTGMLSSAGIIETVADKVEENGLSPLVVDPVMMSKTGFQLLKDSAMQALQERMLPLATVITPNAHEAAKITGRSILSVEDAKTAARELHELGPDAVLVKGGHLKDEPESVDVLFDGSEIYTFTAPRITTDNTHGTGCTLASAIAAHLARGADLSDAVDRAKRYVTGALRNSLDLGEGHGPTNHFFHLDADAALAGDEPAAEQKA